MSSVFYFWCRGPESNRYGCFQPRDFKSRASASSATPAAFLERVMGIEPTWPAWKAGALPLSYTRKYPMELARGIEPPTCWLQVSCSTNWATPALATSFIISHIHRYVNTFFKSFLDLFGCGGKTRTYDLRVMSPTSYQLLHPAIYQLLTIYNIIMLSCICKVLFYFI